MAEVSHDVFIILDACLVHSVPTGAMTHFREGQRNIPPHVTLRLFVSEHKSATQLFSWLQKIAPADFENFYCVATMQEAREKIGQARNS